MPSPSPHATILLFNNMNSFYIIKSFSHFKEAKYRMAVHYEHLFSPLHIKTMHLKNRIVMSPMGSNFAQSDGMMTPEHIEYYRLRAEGGVGLIIMENVCVDYPKGANGTTQLRLDQDCFMPSLYKFNEEMHRYGCCTAVQINHAGCTAIPGKIGAAPVSPSAILLADGSYSEEITVDEIIRLAKQFGNAAARAKMSGFDAVEIHAGHGYLINQFLSPTWNHRTDEFGGSIENRARFCRMVIDEVRKAVGADYPVLMRMSLEEFTSTGNTLEESLSLLDFLRDGIDILDASVGVKFAMDVPQLPDGWRTFVAKAVKERFGMLCAVMGNIRSPQMANDLIACGETDLIVIGRGLIADPAWANKAKCGKIETIRPCISCNIGCVKHRSMLNRPIRCTVNPSISNAEWHKYHSVKKRCNVVVVGGGVSGLEAACSAAEAGCSVTLLEEKQQLGGWLRMISAVPEKYRMKRLLAYYLQRAEKLKNLVCLTDVTATAELVHAFKPDLVVWAVGSEPARPPIPGLNACLADPNAKIMDVLGWLNSLDHLAGITGQEIILAGGGPVALDIAEFFAVNGNHVTIVDILPEIGRGLDNFSKRYFLELLEKHNATILLSHRIEEFTPSTMLVSGIDGQRKLHFDYAFCCLGLKPKAKPVEAEQYFARKNIPMITVGDGKQPRQMFEGISEGRGVIEALKSMDFF